MDVIVYTGQFDYETLYNGRKENNFMDTTKVFDVSTVESFRRAKHFIFLNHGKDLMWNDFLKEREEPSEPVFNAQEIADRDLVEKRMNEYENSLREVKEHNNKIELYCNAYEKLMETEFEDLEETDLAYLDFLYEEGIEKTVNVYDDDGLFPFFYKKKIVIA